MLQQKFSFRYMLLEQAREWGRRCMKGGYQRKRRIHTIERARNYVSIYLSILRLVMISCLESIELCHPFIPIIHSLIELDAIPARESEKIYHEPNEKTGGMRKDVTIVLIETPSSISESNWQNYAGAIVNNNYAYGAAKRQSFSIIFSKYYQLSIQFIYGIPDVVFEVIILIFVLGARKIWYAELPIFATQNKIMVETVGRISMTLDIRTILRDLDLHVKERLSPVTNQKERNLKRKRNERVWILYFILS